MIDGTGSLLLGSSARLISEQEFDQIPSFLYVMPLGPKLLFVEETVLVARPAVSLTHLRDRLLTRLSLMGLRPKQVLEEEKCWIQMGDGLPHRKQPVLSFGAAASFVHPATGYSISHSIRKAPLLADVISESLDQGLPNLAIRRGWDILWPSDQARQWELYRFGMDILCSLNAPQTRRWFDNFLH